MMTEQEYRIALARVSNLVEKDPELSSDEGIELNSLVEKILYYERDLLK